MNHLQAQFAVLLTLCLAATFVNADETKLPGEQVGNGRVVRVSDMDMYYEVQGDGPPLVLLHAYLGTGYFQWKAYIDRGASRTCRMCVQSTADATS